MKVRLKYSKTDQGRFLSHLDLLRTMQRVIRRAGLPLAYSEGFNPHPKISYGSALAVGVTSDGEYLDFELKKDFPLPEIVERIEQAMPSALQVLEAKELVGSSASLMAIINLARYQVTVPLNETLSDEQAEKIIRKLLAEKQIIVMREGKKGIRCVDIRPGIFDLTVKVKEQSLILLMDLQTGSNGNVRPDEVAEWLHKETLAPLGVEINGNLRIHRQGLFIKEANRIMTPLD